MKRASAKERGNVKNLVTPFALVKRAEKMISDIDKYFEEADSFGLNVHQSDPDGTLRRMRLGLIEMRSRHKQNMLASRLPAERGAK